MVLAVHTVVYGTLASQVVYLAVTWLAALLAWWGAVRTGRRPGTVALACGVTLSAVGDLVWQLVSWTGGSTDVSSADVAYVAAYAAVGAGLWRMAGLSGRSRGQQVDGWIDAVVVFIGALLVVWQLSLAATLSDTSVSLATRLVWVLYPAMDAALIGLVFRLVVVRRREQIGALVVAAGAVCWLASDLAYALVELGGISAWTDTGWMLAAVLLGSATWGGPGAGAGAEGPAEEDDDRTKGGLGRLAVCLGALLVPSFIDLLQELTADALLHVPVFAGSLVLAVLIFWRAARLLRGEARARAQVRAQQRYSAALAAHSADAVAVLSEDGRLVSDPSPLTALLGAGREDVATLAALLRRSGVAVADARALADRVRQAGPGVVVESELACRWNGEQGWLGVRLIDLRGDADVRGVVVHATDITARKRAEAAVAHLAFHDPLTGLANRALLARRLERALGPGRRPGSVGLALVDLDGFKGVNDTLGHPAGDELLREIAARLTSAVRAGDLVARLGGDEFAVVVDGGDGAADIEATAARVLELLTRPLVVAGQRVQVSGSIGVALAAPGATSDSLIGDADIAMYVAKAAGRSRVTTFDPAMRAAAQERRLLEQGLRGALGNGELRLVYQPVVDLADGRVHGFEALLRWQSPTLGAVPPDRFVPVAEELGLIRDIGAWVIGEATATAAAWRHVAGTDALTMSVNVSPVQLSSPDLVDVVAEALARTGLAPSTLVLEVTEGALVQDPARAARCLSALRALGVRVALDDFGTGQSSLGHLSRFEVDVLKIDRSFVAAIAPDGQLPPVLRGMIDLGHALDLEIVAEGIELEEQRSGLLDGRCTRAQGYLFARPMEADEAELLLLGGARAVV
ncbi:putative bifunctional diguanylate cyclase/phosphodiesterase [Blastococcus sp. SYSU D00669]